MVERFFFNGGVAAAGDDGEGITLLSGPPSSGKTSLVFQYAINIVATNPHSNSVVVFLCDSRRFHSNPPFLSQGIETSLDIMKRIEIKYIDNHQHLINYFAAFHLLPSFPLAVVVDDFPDFFSHSECQRKYNSPRGKDLAMLRVLALSHSAILHASSKTAPCNLLLSDTHHGDSPRHLFLYNRWVSSFFTVQAQGSGSFLLTDTTSSARAHKSNKEARYSIALHYLVLEGFVEDAYL